jgi:hypothetical protein
MRKLRFTKPRLWASACLSTLIALGTALMPVQDASAANCIGGGMAWLIRPKQILCAGPT